MSVEGYQPVTADSFVAGSAQASEASNEIYKLMTQNPISKAIDHVEAFEANLETAKHDIGAMFHPW